jgi:hypothetical protein
MNAITGYIERTSPDFGASLLKRTQDWKYSNALDFYRPDSYRVKGLVSLMIEDVLFFSWIIIHETLCFYYYHCYT